MINWKIEKLITFDNSEHTNIVKNVEFCIKYETDEKVCETRGNKDIAYNSDSFTEYDSLTETQIVNWVKNILGTVKVEALEALVTTHFNNMEEDDTYLFVYTLDSLEPVTEKTLDDLPF